MADEKRYSVERGLGGCLVVWVALAVGVVVTDLVADMLGSADPASVEGRATLFLWPLALCIGGYYACAKAKTTGWTNAIVVGVFAELLVLGRLSRETEGLTATHAIAAILSDPVPHWRMLTFAVITIPAAFLGGYIWVKRSAVRASSDRV